MGEEVSLRMPAPENSESMSMRGVSLREATSGSFRSNR
jgi:hypothetical protein